MKIKTITFEHARDFSAVMVCEHCGHEQKNDSGYHDTHYHTKVIPAMVCKRCGMNREGEKPIQVHLNTRGCKPMQPETAEALGRMFKAVHEQFSGRTNDG